MKDIIAYILVIACGLVFTYIFTTILLTGGYMAVEPNVYILWAEIAMSVLIFSFGLYCFIDALRKVR